MKDFDGFQVTIEGAENLKPKLIEEVKIWIYGDQRLQKETR